jgi:hypothetical protein
MSRKCDACDNLRVVAIDNDMAGYMACEVCRAADLAAETRRAMTVHLVGVQTDGSLHRWVCSCQCDPGNWVMSARSAREGGRRHLAATDQSQQAGLLVLEELRPPAGRPYRHVVEMMADGVRIYEQRLEPVKNGVGIWIEEYDGAVDVQLSLYAMARLAEFFAHLPDRYPSRT